MKGGSRLRSSDEIGYVLNVRKRVKWKKFCSGKFNVFSL